MATKVMVTESMKARASQLLSQSKTWTRGCRKSDRLAFVLFPSSKPGHAYYCRVDGGACSCSGFLYRGVCSHAIAVSQEYEAAQESAAIQPRVSDSAAKCWVPSCTAPVPANEGGCTNHALGEF